MITAIICREMKWDYWQYQNQPSWFIDVLIEMIKAEAEEINNKHKPEYGQ